MVRLSKGKNYSKLYYGYFAATVTFFILLCLLVIFFFWNIIQDNSAQNRKYFESSIGIAERNLGIYQKISDIIFANESVRSFATETAYKDDMYNYVLMGRFIDSYMKIYKEVEPQFVVTDFKSSMVACRGGTQSLESFLQDFQLDEKEIDLIKNTEKPVCFSKEGTDLLILGFPRSYYVAGSDVYCIICVEQATILPQEEVTIILNDETNANWWTDEQGGIFSDTYKRNSVYMPEIVYEYNFVNNNLYIIVVMCIMILLCFLAIAYSNHIADKLLNITYMPIIKTVKELNLNADTETPKSWDESVDMLLNYNESLGKKIKENEEFFRKNILRNIIYGVETPAELYTNYAKHDMFFSEMTSSCRLILFECYGAEQYGIKEDLFVSNNFIKEFEKLLSQIIKGEFIMLGIEKFAFITACNDKGHLAEKLIHVLDFAEAYGISVFVSVGKICKSLMDISQSYRSACDLNEHKTVYSDRSIVFFEDGVKTNRVCYYPIDLEMSIIENTLLGNFDKVREILSIIFKENLQNDSFDRVGLRDLKMMLVGTVNRIIGQMDKKASDIFGEDVVIYLEISSGQNDEEIEKKVHAIFEHLCQSGANTNVSRQEKLTQNILEFIQNKIKNPELSLADIAEHFFISQGHVSRVLKHNAGRAYKEYVDNVRIKEAKRLLRESHLPIDAISGEVGCANPRTFIRLFKKYTGITPSEYRLNNK